MDLTVGEGKSSHGMPFHISFRERRSGDIYEHLRLCRMKQDISHEHTRISESEASYVSMRAGEPKSFGGADSESKTESLRIASHQVQADAWNK